MTVRGLRFGVAVLWLSASPVTAGVEGRPAPAVVVIASVEVEAHRLAIEGMQEALATSLVEVRILDVGQASSAARSNAPVAPSIGAIIALGSEAIRLVEAERPKVPVVYTMILHRSPEGDRQGRPAPVTIPLDVPLSSLLARLKELFPGKTRLGIILNPAAGGMSAEQLQARAQQMGFTMHVAACAGPGQLIPALVSLRSRADFVWCQPDGTLYNSATIKPLILASVENRLPLIGFSESFVKAGAAIGIYPDFHDVGVQAGEAVRQLLAGQTVWPAEGPRRLKIAVNQSVLRLFGQRCVAASSEEVTVLP